MELFHVTTKKHFEENSAPTLGKPLDYRGHNDIFLSRYNLSLFIGRVRAWKRNPQALYT